MLYLCISRVIPNLGSFFFQSLLAVSCSCSCQQGYAKNGQGWLPQCHSAAFLSCRGDEDRQTPLRKDMEGKKQYEGSGGARRVVPLALRKIEKDCLKLAAD
jgi:hypothetical protein